MLQDYSSCVLVAVYGLLISNPRVLLRRLLLEMSLCPAHTYLSASVFSVPSRLGQIEITFSSSGQLPHARATIYDPMLFRCWSTRQNIRPAFLAAMSETFAEAEFANMSLPSIVTHVSASIAKSYSMVMAGTTITANRARVLDAVKSPAP